MGSPSRFLMGFPLPLPDAYRGWWEAEVGSSARLSPASHRGGWPSRTLGAATRWPFGHP